MSAGLRRHCAAEAPHAAFKPVVPAPCDPLMVLMISGKFTTMLELHGMMLRHPCVGCTFIWVLSWQPTTPLRGGLFAAHVAWRGYRSATMEASTRRCVCLTALCVSFATLSG